MAASRKRRSGSRRRRHQRLRLRRLRQRRASRKRIPPRIYQYKRLALPTARADTPFLIKQSAEFGDVRGRLYLPTFRLRRFASAMSASDPALSDPLFVDAPIQKKIRIVRVETYGLGEVGD